MAGDRVHTAKVNSDKSTIKDFSLANEAEKENRAVNLAKAYQRKQQTTVLLVVCLLL